MNRFYLDQLMFWGVMLGASCFAYVTIFHGHGQSLDARATEIGTLLFFPSALGLFSYFVLGGDQC